MLDKYSVPQQLGSGVRRRFHVMAKPSGSACNLDCTYCFYLSKETLPNGPGAGRMDDETLELFIRQYIDGVTGPEVVFSWQGGEPTLRGLDFFRRVVALQKKYAKPGQRIDNDLQTNGVLLNAEWAAFLKENRFLVGLSIDGPRELHDRFRVNKGGAPTFDKVMAAATLLRQAGVPFNTLTCVHRFNASRPLDVYRFLRRELDATYIQFIPIVQTQGVRDDRAAHLGRGAIADRSAVREARPGHPELGRSPTGRSIPTNMGISCRACSTSGGARISAGCWSITSRRWWRSTSGFPRSSASTANSAARASRSSTTAASTPATTTSTRNTGSGRCGKSRCPKWCSLRAR